MKLNKPPVTPEQSILEEYVEFLLTDLSNVHPIKVESKKKITDLVGEKTPRHDTAQVKSGKVSRKPHTKKPNAEDSQAASATNRPDSHRPDSERPDSERPDSERPDSERQNTQTVESKTGRGSVVSESETTPKWSTIEKAPSKRTVANKSEIKSTGDQPLKASSRVTDHPSKATKDTRDVAAKDTSQPFVEESEALQLEQWDALIAAEKEQKMLAEKEVLDDSTDNFELEAKPDFQQGSIAVLDEFPDYQRVNPDLAKKTQEIIESYLPPEMQQDPRLAGVEKLLSRISLATLPKVKAEQKLTSQQAIKKETALALSAQQAAETAQATFLHRKTQRSREILPKVFQTLIFQVAQLPLAVPLIKLGGILKVTQEDITPLVGTPNWFMGLVPNDRGNLMVVDTQRYLMPEKGLSGARQEYQYLIVLDNSNWALACNSVGDAKNLTQDDIRWAQKSSRRPWFAGMVVDYMSALIEVDELINMLAANIID